MKLQSKKAKLSDLVIAIQTGFQVRGRSQLDSKGNYKLIQVKDTVRGFLYYIKSKKLDKISIPEKNRKFMGKYLIQTNDLLYLSVLNFGAFLYSDTLENTVPMSHFYILRPNINLIDSYYLCWILNHKFLKPYIKRSAEGTTLPFISKQALMSLQIPFPDRAVQKKIVELLKLREREQEIQSRIDRHKNNLINAMLSSSLKFEQSPSLNFTQSPSHKASFTHKTKPKGKTNIIHKDSLHRAVSHSRSSSFNSRSSSFNTRSSSFNTRSSSFNTRSSSFNTRSSSFPRKRESSRYSFQKNRKTIKGDKK